MASQGFKKGFISNIISLIVKLMFIWYMYLDIEFYWYLFHSFVWCMGAEHTMGHVSLKKVNTSITQHAFQFYPFFKQHCMRTCQFGWQCPGRKRTVGQSPVGIHKAISELCFLFAATLLELLRALWATNPKNLFQGVSWGIYLCFIDLEVRRRTLCWCRTIVARTGNARLWIQGVWNQVLGCQFVGTSMSFPNISNSWELYGIMSYEGLQ